VLLQIHGGGYMLGYILLLFLYISFPKANKKLYFWGFKLPFLLLQLVRIWGQESSILNDLEPVDVVMRQPK